MDGQKVEIALLKAQLAVSDKKIKELSTAAAAAAAATATVAAAVATPTTNVTVVGSAPANGTS